MPRYQDNHWLDLKRLQLYTRTAALVFLILAIGLTFQSNVISQGGFPLLFDFGVFWSAAKLALQGHPADAYQMGHLSSVVQGIIPVVKDGAYGWFYPPNFYLIILPLALFPYLWSAFVFMALSLAAYSMTLQRIIGGRDALVCLAGFSGAWINLLIGQNAFLTAALAGAALLALRTRPILAGVFVGLLTIKPQLTVLFPVALIAVGAWSTLLTAAMVSLVFMLVGAGVLGADTLSGWWHSLGLAQIFLENGGSAYWLKMPTVFAFLQLLGAPPGLSYLVHALVAVVAAGVVWQIWRHSPDRSLRNASLITGTFLISPYLFEYDLAWLALPIAWMTKIGLSQGWLRWEREILILVWLLPLMMVLLARIMPLQIGPWVTMALLAMIVRRMRLKPASGSA